MTLFNPETRYTQDVSFVNQQAQEELSQTIQWYDKVYEMEQDFQQKAFKQATGLAGLLGKDLVDYSAYKEALEDDKIYDKPDEEYDVSYGGKKFKDQWNLHEALAAEENTEAARLQLQNEDPMLIRTLLEGDGKKQTAKRLLTGLSDGAGAYHAYASANFKVKLPAKFGTRAGLSVTADEAEDGNERTYIENAIRHMYFKQAQGTPDNKIDVHMRRKFLHPGYKKAEQAARLKWEQSYKEAVTQGAKDNREDDLRTDVKARGGEAVEAYINKYAGMYGGFRTSRKETFNILGDAAEAGSLNRGHVKAIREHEITGRDGNKHHIGKYWKEDIDALYGKVIDFETEQHTIRENAEASDIKNYAFEKEAQWKKQDTPVTEDQLKAAEDEFRKLYPNKTFPERLSKWRTAQDELDEHIDKRLWKQYRLGERPISRDDLKGITSETLFAEWLPRVKASSVLALSAADVKKRDGRLVAEINKYTKEAHALGKSPKWTANQERATAHFTQQYRKYMKSNPDDPSGAFSQAWEDTHKKIWNGDFNEYERHSLSKPTALNNAKILDNIAKNPEIISTGVIPGTEEYVKAGARLMETGKGTIPGIYRLISARMKPDENGVSYSPWQIMAQQVQLAAAQDGDKAPKFEEAKVDQDVNNQVSFEDKVLLLHKPSAGRTNRVLQNAETLDWFLDNIKTTEDYDYILSPTGGDAHLDKPLTEHTVSEVISLLESGHEAPGAYGFPPTLLLKGLQATNLPGDRLYDKVTQDLLALYVGKDTDFRGGFYADSYNLSAESIEKQETIADNIPPFNRSENILKALHGYGGNVPVTQ